jgi:hypothetical protein
MGIRVSLDREGEGFMTGITIVKGDPHCPEARHGQHPPMTIKDIHQHFPNALQRLGIIQTPIPPTMNSRWILGAEDRKQQPMTA